MPYNEFSNFSEFSAWARNLPENSTSSDDPLALLDEGKVPGKWLGRLWGREVKNLIYVDRGSVRDRLGIAEKPYRTQSPPDLKHLDAQQREQVLDGLNEAPRAQHENFQKDRKKAETAARQQVVALIEDEYGPEVAAKVF